MISVNVLFDMLKAFLLQIVLFLFDFHWKLLPTYCKWSSVGVDNCMAPYGRKAVIWANGGLVYGVKSRRKLSVRMQTGKLLLTTWWRHQMETFSVLLAICAGNSPDTGEFPAQRPVTRCFGVFFDLRLNNRSSKQPWGWWFETPSCSLWRHCNGNRLVLGEVDINADIRHYLMLS